MNRKTNSTKPAAAQTKPSAAAKKPTRPKAKASAVQAIFAAKGRPADHPLIVHLAPGAAPGGWTWVLVRQGLMPAINRATDTGERRRFQWLHGLSVLVTLAHIGATGWLLAHIA